MFKKNWSVHCQNHDIYWRKFLNNEMQGWWIHENKKHLFVNDTCVYMKELNIFTQDDVMSIMTQKVQEPIKIYIEDERFG